MSKCNCINDFINVRKKILKEIRAEMIGPGSEDIGPDIEFEVITESPLQRYNLGILYPQKVIQSDIDEENINLDGFDERINLSNQFLPSTMGLTFFTNNSINDIVVNVKYSKYKRSTFENACIRVNTNDEKIFKDPLISEFIYKENDKIKLKKKITINDINRLKVNGIVVEDKIENLLYKLCSQCSDNAYIRQPKELKVKINLNESNNILKYRIENENLELCIYKRSYNNNVLCFSVILVNINEGKAEYDNSYFQTEITITTEDNPDMKILEYLENPYFEISQSDKFYEEQSLNLLYRNKKTYAIGHGVSVVCEVDKNTNKGYIKTDFMPIYEVPKLNFNIEEIKSISDKVLSMKNLSDLSSYGKEKIILLLEQFINAYSNWIKSLEKEIDELDNKYKRTAERHINKCKIACDRMNIGIKTLKENENVFKAFQLTNRAMYMQRLHSKLQGKDRFPGEIGFNKINYKDSNNDVFWRPFQLAFLLMCIKSIDDHNSFDRDIVDLIWVPTGGGKTEAYLGLTAFTIFLRRLKDPTNSGGTTVIMRYTLRLLAAQQFIRSSILICACELIRRENKFNLGREPITIGLWIGGESTPNKIQKAKESINELYKCSRPDMLEYIKEKNNKFQLLKCPWCGTKLVKEVVNGKIKGEWGYSSQPDRMLFCPEEECEFNSYLPIKVVDEIIYKEPPTLLFGTVDKFAMITWEEETSKLFALDKGDRNKSPELIIQDELHLISGPLGTIVGLYETAIDKLCSAKGIKPKIIASTATIRRAEEQCKNLYARDVMQFPSPGLSAEDSFFTREIEVNENNPGRLYVGIMPTGKTLTTLEIRLIATLLQRIGMMDISDDLKDKYWTLTGYFNSIRELGKCSTLINDDVKDFMRRISNRIADKNVLRYITEADELTSRISSNMISETLNKLEQCYSKENIKNKKYPVNVLLATNMISVGVDVSRLNLMFILGQPKLTSEYIQASSRVGREYPGLVFTLYDPNKSRDRSHYENFWSYHQSFYKFVEPTSVTPFSAPSRERALHAILISMIRHIGGLNSEEMATNFDRNMEITNEIKEFIIQRVAKIDKGQVEDIIEEINYFWDYWSEKINCLSEGELLTYTKSNQKHIIKPFGKKDSDYAIETLQSMRNVDYDSGAHIIIFGDDENESNR